MKYSSLHHLTGIATLATLLTGCGPAMPDMQTQPPPVSFTVVAEQNLTLNEELAGRIVAYRSAEIRPQISGIIQKRLFEQGSEVHAGSALFQINPAPFQAEADNAGAAVVRAEAAYHRAAVQVQRLDPLARTEAISQQVYDDAIAQRDQTKAELAQARAELARRRLNLRFALVEAPISGRIEQAQLTEGALVSPSDATPMAKIHDIGQVYLDLRQPAGTLAIQPAQTAAKAKAPDNLPVTVLDNDGRPLDVRARLLFSGISVDEGTGDVLLRVLIDNKERRLLPGMFARARIARAQYPHALAVPQQAVVRSGNQAEVWVLSGKNTVRAVPVELAELIDDQYRVISGLKTGDKVIVEGLDRMSAGAAVTPHAWSSASATQRNAAASARQPAQ